MVKKGRFTVELIRADTRVAFMEHTKDDKTYAEVEPDVEYFVRLETEPGLRVHAEIYVDGKHLGYAIEIGSPLLEKETTDKGLWSFDGISSTDQALKFAKAKVFDSADETENTPFWTGNIEVKFYELFDTGEIVTRQPFQNTWDGGDVGPVMGLQTDSNMKGVMSTEGKTVINGKEEKRKRKYRRIGRKLASIKLHYCSTVGLIFAGVLGPVNPIWLARKVNEYKRGAEQVAAEAANMPPPKKIRWVPEIDGLPFGLPIEYELFDLTRLDEEKVKQKEPADDEPTCSLFPMHVEVMHIQVCSK
jgi:hypothetical protein